MNGRSQQTLGRLLAGFDMVCGGIRIIVGAAGPEEVATQVDGLRKETLKAFEAKAEFEVAQAILLQEIKARLDSMAPSQGIRQSDSKVERAWAEVLGRLQSGRD